MKKTALWIQSMILLVFIAVFFCLNLVMPDKTFSEQENRYLQTAPKFSFRELFDGKFTSKFETYVTDQFAFRDTWTSIKARAELFVGKESNNGVYYCEDGVLIEPYTAPKVSDLEFNLDAINTLAENQEIPVCFALIPSACEIWKDKLPDAAPNDSQKDTIDHAYAYVKDICTADVYSALAEHKDESIFYKTDHHWTTLGAYYGYTAIAQALGLDVVPLETYSEEVVNTEFYGTTYSSSGYSWVAPDRISRYVSQGDAIVTNYPTGEAVETSLYDESALGTKDKYKYFYGGNTPLLTIETGLQDAPSLLILRDSYMDSLSPYLFAHYSEIHIMDLRYYRASLSAYIDENDFDQILVCYNVKNFVEDGNIFLAGF